MIQPKSAAVVRPTVFISAPKPSTAPIKAPSLASISPSKVSAVLSKPQQAFVRQDTKPLPKFKAVAPMAAEANRAAKEAADRAAWNAAQQSRLDANAAAQAANPQDYGTPTAQTEAQAQEAQADDREAAPSEQAAQQARDAQPQDAQQQLQEAQEFVAPTAEPPPQDWESDIQWQEMQGFAGEDEPMQVFAHVYNGEMCATGLCPTPFGIVPVQYSVIVPDDTPNGPVIAGAELPETLNETIAHTVKVLEMKAKKDELALAAESLVERTRAGDQNAMGMIAMIKQNAGNGSPRAKRSLDLIADYIRRNPVKDVSNPFGNENKPDESNVLFRACVALANGAPLSNTRIQAMASTFGTEDEEKLFLYAVVNYKKPDLIDGLAGKFGQWVRNVVQLGKNVGTARGIQLVRMPGTAVSAFDAKVGWELGE